MISCAKSNILGNADAAVIASAEAGMKIA